VQAVQREQHAGFLQCFVVFHHRGDGVGIGQGARGGGFVAFGDHQHHESHLNTP
jgi:hypothetical protein